MFFITSDKTIHLTRGDVATIEVSANTTDGELNTFKEGDVVRFQIIEKRKLDNVILRKDTVVEQKQNYAEINLLREDTKIGNLESKPVDYWYEIEINPDTNPQTIIGYDNEGPKIFRLYPEGDDGYVTNS